LGTGIVVDPSGLILTCAHVVAGESRVTVVLPGAREVFGTVSVIDPASDLALVKVESANLTALDLRRAPKLRQGGLLYLVSRPGGAIARFTEGTLAAEGTFHAGHSDIEFLRQFLGEIEPGDSGGALVDDQGQLVGLLSSGVPQGRVGYAIARELVILALARLRAGPPVVWPWIGLGVETTEDGSGVQVWTVAKGSPAEAAGLRAGDRIVAIDGHPIEHFLPAMMAVIARPIGTRFRIEMHREGSDAATVVRLASAPRPLEPDLGAFDVFEKLTGIRLGAEPPAPGSPGRVVVLDGGAPMQEPPERSAYARGSRLVSVLPGFGVVLSLEEGRDDQEIPIASAEDLGHALRASTIGTTMTAVFAWSTDGKRRSMLLSGEAKRFPFL
jgi:serine protease Do